MKSAAAIVLVACAFAAAATYPVEVDSQMNGLAVSVKTSSGTPLVVTFVSGEKADVRCKAEIASGFDTPQDRTVVVKPGKVVPVTFNLRSAPNRVRVIASCAPAPVKSGG